jgi:hypothetical protein
MALRPLEAIHQAIGEHQREISELEQRIVHLKSQIITEKKDMNAHALVNRCPPEILARIFFFCRPDIWRNPRSLKRFLSLTHVCNLWRMSALEHPELWNLVPCCDVETTEWMLERAKSAPLVLRGLGKVLHGLGDEASDEEKQCEVNLLEHSARIQALSLDFESYDASTYLLGAIQNFLQKPAPLLESLCLMGLDSSSLIDMSPLIFCGHMPKLRAMYLDGMTFTQLGAPCFRQLRTLYLTRISNKISLSTMAQALQDMSGMEKLVLLRVLSWKTVGKPDQEICHIVLSHLRLLSVHDPADLVTELLNSLEAPTLICLHVIHDPPKDKNRPCDIRYVSLVKSYLNVHGASFMSCHIVQRPDRVAVSAFGPNPLVVDCPCSSYYPTLIQDGAAFGFSTHDNRDRIVPGEHTNDVVSGTAALVLAMARTLRNLEHIKTLIRIDRNESRQHELYCTSWPGFLRDLPLSLTHFSVHQTSFSSMEEASGAFIEILIRALGGLDQFSPAHTISPSGGMLLPAPHLRVFTLSTELITSGSATRKIAILQSLSACLRARALCGSLLERLELLSCSEDDHDVMELEREGLVGQLAFEKGEPWH